MNKIWESKCSSWWWQPLVPKQRSYKFLFWLTAIMFLHSSSYTVALVDLSAAVPQAASTGGPCKETAGPDPDCKKAAECVPSPQHPYHKIHESGKCDKPGHVCCIKDYSRSTYSPWNIRLPQKKFTTIFWNYQRPELKRSARNLMVEPSVRKSRRGEMVVQRPLHSSLQMVLALELMSAASQKSRSKQTRFLNWFQANNLDH